MSPRVSTSASERKLKKETSRKPQSIKPGKLRGFLTKGARKHQKTLQVPEVNVEAEERAKVQKIQEWIEESGKETYLDPDTIIGPAPKQTAYTAEVGRLRAQLQGVIDCLHDGGIPAAQKEVLLEMRDQRIAQLRAAEIEERSRLEGIRKSKLKDLPPPTTPYELKALKRTRHQAQLAASGQETLKRPRTTRNPETELELELVGPALQVVSAKLAAKSAHSKITERWKAETGDTVVQGALGTYFFPAEEIKDQVMQWVRAGRTGEGRRMLDEEREEMARYYGEKWPLE